MLRDLARSQQMGIMLIEQNVSAALEVADVVHVLAAVNWQASSARTSFGTGTTSGICSKQERKYSRETS